MMKKGLLFILCFMMVTTTCLCGVTAEDLVLGMSGHTFTASDETVLPYRMYAPTADAPETGYAVFIHLHGAGERGTDNVAQTTTGMELVNKIIAQKGQETIVLVPQCPEDGQWVDVPFGQGTYSVDQVPMSRYLSAVMELLEQVKQTYKVDTSRLYLAGLSMGGYGVWDLLARYPQTFAAAIPVCGGGDPTKAQNMADVAIRTYHSSDDPIVPVEGTRAMRDAINAVGGDLSYREYSGKGHSIWSTAFTVTTQISWMFGQARADAPQDPVLPDTPVFAQGDANQDTLINAKDALEVLKHSVGKIVLTEEQLLLADVNLDNQITAKDALEILKYTVGKITEFPKREPVIPNIPEPPQEPEDPQDPEVPQEPVIPTQPPVDTSTGKINPRLAPAVYTTEVVVADIIPTLDGYAVDATGTFDSFAGIQRALNDCAKAGGGTVFLSEGTYLITQNLSIPPRVTLMGDWNDPDLEEAYGTVILANVPSEDTNQGGLFTLSGSSGVVGLTIYYPDQSLEEIKPYPAVFYTNGQGASYMLSTVKNCTVINGYRGIGACCHTENTNAHEQLTVENVKGTFLYTAAEIYNQADVGTWENVVVSGRYWANAHGETMVSVNRDLLNVYTTNHTVGMMLGDLEWTEFSGLTVEHCNVGLKIVKGQRIQFAGSLYNISLRHCAIGILVEDLDPRWGMLIANSRVDNGIQNKTNGLVKAVNVSLEGNGCLGAVEVVEETAVESVTLPKQGYTQPNKNLVVATLVRNGATDVSEKLQEYLDLLSGTGGIVYVKAGTYRLDRPVIIPAGVQLRGCSSVATRGIGGNGDGTVFLAYYGTDATDPLYQQALFTLNGDHAGMYGIRITYPKNGPYDQNLATTYAIRGNGTGVYVENCCITAAGYGIDFTGCDGHYIKKVMTCCYYNTFRLGGENGVVTGCLQNGTVLSRCSDQRLENWLNEADIFTDLFNPILRKTAEYIIVENAKNQTIYNTFVYGCKTMITAQGVTDLLAVNIGCDNIGSDGYQMVLESGTATVINSMRYNGKSYKKDSGTLALYNRLTINNKNEKNGIY